MCDGGGCAGKSFSGDGFAQDAEGAREAPFLFAEVRGGEGVAALGRAFQRRTSSDGAAGANALLDFVGRL